MNYFIMATGGDEEVHSITDFKMPAEYNNTAVLRSPFFSNVHYREVRLRIPQNILRYSFIVQDTICYLDLEVSKNDSFANNCEMIEFNLNNSASKDLLINTEEKCRKMSDESRNLLYRLHLDLARRREWSLKSDSQPDNLWLDPAFPHIAKIRVAKDFYALTLYRFIEYACDNDIQKMRVLKWFLKLFASKHNYVIPARIVDYFVECMHPECNDSEFVNDCFVKLNFTYWALFNERPTGVRNLLYQIHLLGRNPPHVRWSYFFTERCLAHPTLLYINDILKYRHALSLCSNVHFYLLNKVVKNFRTSSLRQFKKNLKEKKIVSWRSQQRATLFLQCFWVFLNLFENIPAASEALRLVWNSVPDAFISREEIEDVFKNVLSPNEITGLYTFYSDAVQEHHELGEPRSLKHYCRIAIRKSLWRSKQWIPDGVKRFGLPMKLESFLNLEY